ncbi:hypothetical protein CAP39_06530 [Sphingomonas sp. IBVSS1]|nr:hypothetical protein CAP39_06530 [Sphingomonas sp. IBVSS1]
MTRGFWGQALHLWCWQVAGFGLLFAAGGLAGADAAAGLYYWLVSGGQLDAGAFDAPGMRSTLGVMGGLMFGWGVSLIAVYRAVGADVRVWRALGWGVAGWFMVDSALSLATGLPGNAIANTLFLIQFLVPAVKLGFFSRETASRSPA